MDICQLVEAKIAALGVQTRAEIQSMIVHEIIDYNTNHLFSVLCENVDAVIEQTVATGLLSVNVAIPQKINTTVVRAVENKIKDKQADSSIRRATRRKFELELFVRDVSQRIVDDETVVKSLANHARCHVDKVLDE